MCVSKPQTLHGEREGQHISAIPYMGWSSSRKFNKFYEIWEYKRPVRAHALQASYEIFSVYEYFRDGF